MAKKAAKQPAAVTAPSTTDATTVDTLAADKAAMVSGKRPFTLRVGTYRDIRVLADGTPQPETEYKAGDVVFSDRDLATDFPDKFTAGRITTDATGAIRSAPGLGILVGEEILTYGYEVYSKNGLLHAYTPGNYGTPASPDLIDLAAAEEWCLDNKIAEE